MDDVQVIRVKRKLTEGPFDSLVIDGSSKKSSKFMNSRKRVFKLVDTADAPALPKMKQIRASEIEETSNQTASLNNLNQDILENPEFSEQWIIRSIRENTEEGMKVLDALLEYKRSDFRPKSKKNGEKLLDLDKLQLDDEEVVYDIYMEDFDAPVPSAGSKWLPLSFFEPEFVLDEADEYVNEFDEDSNSEGYWGNDYPDEDPDDIVNVSSEEIYFESSDECTW